MNYVPVGGTDPAALQSRIQTFFWPEPKWQYNAAPALCEQKQGLLYFTSYRYSTGTGTVS